MGLRHAFSTTIYSWDGSLAVEATTIPRDDVWDPGVFRTSESLLAAFDLTVVGPVRPDQAPSLLATLLAVHARGPEAGDEWLRSVRVETLEQSFFFQPQHRQFADELLNSSRLPVLESPVQEFSLGALLGKASIAGLGVGIALAVAGPTPLLVLLFPATLVLLYAAIGVGEGAREGLRIRTRKFLTGK